MAAAALVGNVRQAFFIDGRLVATDEIRLSDGHPLIGVRIDDLRERESALVIDVQRNGENLLLPDLDSVSGFRRSRHPSGADREYSTDTEPITLLLTLPRSVFRR